MEKLLQKVHYLYDLLKELWVLKLKEQGIKYLQKKIYRS